MKKVKLTELPNKNISTSTDIIGVDGSLIGRYKSSLPVKRISLSGSPNFKIQTNYILGVHKNRTVQFRVTGSATMHLIGLFLEPNGSSYIKTYNKVGPHSYNVTVIVESDNRISFLVESHSPYAQFIVEDCSIELLGFELSR